MAKTREEKEATVKALTEALKEAKAVVFADYHGLSVREQQELQANMRTGGMKFGVVKNNLFTKAAKDAGLKLERPSGPVAVAYGFDDPVAVAKGVAEFAKEHESLELTGGFVDGEPVEITVIQKLASLPGREELIGKLVGSISAPARNLAGGLSAISRNLAYALNAVKEAKGEAA